MKSYFNILLCVFLLIFIYCDNSDQKIPTNVIIHASFLQGYADFNRFMAYNIEIYNHNSKWIIIANDGSADENGHVFISVTQFRGVIPESKIRELFDNILEWGDELNNTSGGIDSGESEFTLKIFPQIPSEVGEKYRELSNISLQNEGINPFKGGPQNKSEEIHYYILELAKKYATKRFFPSENLPSNSGKVHLIKPIAFFDEGFKTDEVIQTKTKTIDIRYSSNSIKEPIYLTSTGNKILLRNSQLFLIKNNREISISPVMNIGDNFYISNNEKFLIFGQKILPGNSPEALYFLVDLYTIKTYQILSTPFFILDFQIDTNGEVYFTINGEVYKFILNTNG